MIIVFIWRVRKLRLREVSVPENGRGPVGNEKMFDSKFYVLNQYRRLSPAICIQTEVGVVHISQVRFLGLFQIYWCSTPISKK